MRNGKYKAFYVSNEQHDEINAMLKQCQEITLEQINELYPSTRKIIINITENDKFVTISADKDHENEDDLFGRSQVIPKGVILEIQYLQVRPSGNAEYTQ